MTQIYPTIRTNELTDQGPTFNHSCTSYRLSTKGDHHVFKSGVTLFVLTINRAQNYLVLDAYIGQEDEPVDSVFLQGTSIAECIGRDWRSLSVEQLATRMINLFA